MKAATLSFQILFALYFQDFKNFFKKKYYAIINIRKSLKFKKYERVLEEALYKEELSQADLMITIKNRIKNFYPKGISQYIPLTWKQKREIRAAIYFEYGEQMKKFKVKLNKDLKFI